MKAFKVSDVVKFINYETEEVKALRCVEIQEIGDEQSIATFQDETTNEIYTFYEESSTLHDIEDRECGWLFNEDDERESKIEAITEDIGCWSYDMLVELEQAMATIKNKHQWQGR